MAELQCFMHVESIDFEKLKPLTKIIWNKFTTCCKSWIRLSGRECDIAEKTQSRGLLDLSYKEATVKEQGLGFHETCYRRFIDSKRIRAGEKRKAQEDAGANHHSNSGTPKRCRRRSPGSSNTGVLPVKCIICSKEQQFVTRQGKRVKDKLQLAETFDAGI